MSKAKKTTATTRKRPWLKWMILGPLIIVTLVQLYFLLMVCWYNVVNPRMTNMMSDQLAVMREKNPKASLQQKWVPYAAISNNLKRAVIASEDANFADHDGVDWEALQKAYERNNRKHKVVGGGSTITQQLAKNLFLSGSRSYLRKGQELVLAYMIEHVMSKERILELYLNVAEWGVGVFGAQAAAKHYFNTTAANLGNAQSARLAAMLPNPRFYDSHRKSNYLNSRVGILTRRMQLVDIP
jgi:monofunctional glycosyltransferase